MSQALTKKDLWKVFWHQMTIRGANNYERQQNAGFTQALIPVIEKVYKTKEEKKAAYERHMEYFDSRYGFCDSCRDCSGDGRNECKQSRYGS